MAPPTTGLTIVKRFDYRGNTQEEWSNHYWLSGSTPADNAAWRTLFDLLCTEEKKCYTGNTSIVGGYGYSSTADDAHAVWSVDLTVAPWTPVLGSLPVTGGIGIAGDQAGWVRWTLDRFNSKGKRIYLRKYFHGGLVGPAGGDALLASWVTAMNNFGQKLQDGTFTGARVTTDKLGTAVIGHAVSPFVTTRTLKRRGKRPPT